ncbi:MAG TPA: hypothetical protein VGE51_10055 [Fontimonas sp.]
MTSDQADHGRNAALQLRSEYLLYLRDIVDCITNAMTGLPAGPRRLFVAVEAFWEACYQRRADRLRMLEAAEQTQTQAHLDALSEIFTRMLEVELRACGALRPDELAGSLLSEVRDVARAELFAGHRLPWERRRLMGFMESRVGIGPVAGLPPVTSPVAAVSNLR